MTINQFFDLEENPVIVFKRNRNLRKLIISNRIVNNKIMCQKIFGENKFIERNYKTRKAFVFSRT